MVLRLSVLALVLSVALAGGAIPTAADGKKRKRTACQRLAGKDLAPAKLLKVVRRDVGGGALDVRACTLRGGKVRKLASYDPDGEFARGDIDVVDSGDRHVLLLEFAGEKGFSSTLVRVDTRTYRRTEIASETCDPFQFCIGDKSTAVVLHRSGAVAAFVQPNPTSFTDTIVEPPRLKHFPVSGPVSVLDEGPDLDGLRVAGDTFTWTRGSEAKSAPVRPR